MSNRATKQLSSDHQLILQALDLLRQLSGHLANGEPVERNDIQALLEFFQQFVHEYHDAKEEMILIPVLVETGRHLHDGALMPIVSGHHELNALMTALRAAFQAGKDEEFVKLSEEYQKALSGHIFTEDRLLFESMTNQLDQVSDRRILNRFNEFEPGLGERSKAKLMMLLRSRKYETPLSV